MDLDALRALHALAATGSFLDAQRSTGVPRTTLRRRLDALEAQVGAPLLVRDRIGFVPTSIGRALLEQSEDLLARAQALSDRVATLARSPEGLVRVAMPTSVHPLSAWAIAHVVRAKHPKVQLHLRFDPDPVQALATSADVAMHWGERVPDGPWIARRVGSIPLRLLAARAYADIHGVPQTVDEIADHDVLWWDGLSCASPCLPLRAGGSVPVSPFLRTNHLVLCHDAARMGGGLALVPDVRLPGETWDPDEVVRVLVDEVGTDLPVWMVSATAMSERPAVAPIIDDLTCFLAQLVGR